MTENVIKTIKNGALVPSVLLVVDISVVGSFRHGQKVGARYK